MPVRVVVVVLLEIVVAATATFSGMIPVLLSIRIRTGTAIVVVSRSIDTVALQVGQFRRQYRPEHTRAVFVRPRHVLQVVDMLVGSGRLCT